MFQGNFPLLAITLPVLCTEVQVLLILDKSIPLSCLHQNTFELSLHLLPALVLSTCEVIYYEKPSYRVVSNECTEVKLNVNQSVIQKCSQILPSSIPFRFYDLSLLKPYHGSLKNTRNTKLKISLHKVSLVIHNWYNLNGSFIIKYCLIVILHF